ncbi:hypothetical protein THUN1379_19210 [Paludibacterium sp. THUN1379]|nr:hypothetical protein THUN1379_19210 [Paludibacterium sp. THUN1379]
MLLNELLDWFFFIQGNANHHDVAWLPFLAEGIEHGHFLAARAAPGAPEIDDDPLAAQVGQFDLAAIQVGEDRLVECRGVAQAGQEEQEAKERSEQADHHGVLWRKVLTVHGANGLGAKMTRNPDKRSIITWQMVSCEPVL